MIKPITVICINVHITNNERKVYITESVSRDFSEYICIRNSFTKNMSKGMEIQKKNEYCMLKAITISIYLFA